MQLEKVYEEHLRKHVKRMVGAQEALRGDAGDVVAAARQKSRDRASRGVLPSFMVGDYVLVARVTRQGRNHKLVSSWTGPWRVVNDDRDHLYVVQNIVTGETRDVHVARMLFYCDAILRVTSRLQDSFQHLEHQAEYHIRGIPEIKKATLGDEYVVLVQWERLDEAKSTWEPVSRILEDAPAMLKKQIRLLKPSAVVKEGLNSWSCGRADEFSGARDISFFFFIELFRMCQSNS